jgi:hypothetical protein
VPVLLFSGEHDPVTPPRWGEKALEHLPRGRHLVVAAGGHGSTMRGCAPRLVRDFLIEPDEELDASCLGDWKPPPFFTSLAGPTP